MDLRHLRYFIAVAEELHFGRAAERLNIEQSPLSRTIKKLESDLGVILFERTSRGTRLTWAGQVFLEDARRVLLCLEQAKTNAKAASTGYQPSEFVKRYLPQGTFDLLIADEAHEYKNGGSAQGQAMGVLAARSRKTLLLTGTLMGGYGDDLFHLLFRALPGRMIEDGYARQPERDSTLIHHSDRGSQYVSIRYSERLSEAGVQPSVGSKGDSYDNALAETINGLYKAELIHRRAPWKTREAVELATLEWVSWFNHLRLLEPIGYMPPAEAEANYYRQLARQASSAEA